MLTTYKSIINHLREGNIDQRELNSLEDGLERTFKRIEDLENESYKNNEQKKEMQAHIDCLKAELAEIQMNKQELPAEPIKVVNMLINEHIEHIKEFDECFTEVNAGKIVARRPIEEFRQMQIGKLKQIAEHLLVYCNHAEVE